MRPEEYANQFRCFSTFPRSSAFAFSANTFLVACGPASNDLEGYIVSPCRVEMRE